MDWASIDWEIIVGTVAIVGFLWKLNRDICNLEVRMTDKLTKEVHNLGDKVSGLGERISLVEGSLFHPPPPSLTEKQEK